MKRLRVFLPIVAIVLVTALAVVLFRTEPALPDESIESGPAGEMPAIASTDERLDSKAGKAPAIASADEGIDSEPDEAPATASPNGQAAYEPVEEPQDELQKKVQFLLDRIVDSLSASSNLHNDLKENADFEELVSMGRPALYEMYAKSHGDGLREYVMAAACARILGVYDDERGIGTDSGVEWFMKYGIFDVDDLHIVDADRFEFMTTDSLKKEVLLPDGTDRRNLDEVISNYILARQRRFYYRGEKALETHHIYRTEEVGDTTEVYMLVRFGWFEFQDGVFTCISGSGGIPTKMVLKKDKDNRYEVVSYEEPLDGSLWLSSLQELFPNDLVELVTGRDERAELDKRQVEILQQKAVDYLKSIGREGAPVDYRYRPEHPDEGIRKALYQVIGMRRIFPDWAGSREALICTGGPYPGMSIRCIMETSAQKAGEGEYIVTLKRTWDAEINGVQPISIWKYRVSGNFVTLIEEQNMDDFVYLIK